MTTIVSAFISNVNWREDRNINKYYALGKLLLKSTTPKIIFLDEIMYKLIKNIDYDEDNTMIIEYNKSDMYLYKFVNELFNFKLNTDNLSKDTMDYIFTMCNKTEFIRKAIELDVFNSTNYVWVDFGIRHVFDCTDDVFIQTLNALHNKQYNKIRMGHIWDLSTNYNIDLIRNIAWYFAGGVFGGDKNSLLTFADLMKTKCTEIIYNNNTIMWEVNIWYIIYNENSELFSPYKCNHSNSIINNY